MSARAVNDCEFATERLHVEPWHAAADRVGLDLAAVVAELLTVRTTVALPESWRGDFTDDRARAWIAERDADSSMLLVVETSLECPVGVVVLGEAPLDDSAVDVRIGYVVAEGSWGRGIATELLQGLIAWARSRPVVHRLTGGVDLTNTASVRVLEKGGFRSVSRGNDGWATYQLDVEY